MNRRAYLLRLIAFLVSTVISASVFGGFAAWAVSSLDPATQEVIGLFSSPWPTASRHWKLAPAESATGLNGGGDSGASTSPSASRP
ncbi:MAG: hypothetical protein E6H66_19740 [Betaproteobacteria bacterium]|nr:MAG: hypothetical protein E6H66_19740 [Betaproteobacteria bacterium]